MLVHSRGGKAAGVQSMVILLIWMPVRPGRLIVRYAAVATNRYYNYPCPLAISDVWRICLRPCLGREPLAWQGGAQESWHPGS